MSSLTGILPPNSFRKPALGSRALVDPIFDQLHLFRCQTAESTDGHLGTGSGGGAACGLGRFDMGTLNLPEKPAGSGVPRLDEVIGGALSGRLIDEGSVGIVANV